MSDLCKALGTEIIHGCLDDPRCLNPQFAKIQYLYVDALAQMYEAPQYTGLDLLGSIQAGGGIAGASVGHPLLEYWSPAELMMSNCIHPSTNTTANGGNAGGFEIVFENLYDMYFSKYV
jgi:hypothetical protein